jgi:hypothetical protein
MKHFNKIHLCLCTVLILCFSKTMAQTTTRIEVMDVSPVFTVKNPNMTSDTIMALIGDTLLFYASPGSVVSEKLDGTAPDGGILIDTAVRSGVNNSDSIYKYPLLAPGMYKFYGPFPSSVINMTTGMDSLMVMVTSSVTAVQNPASAAGVSFYPNPVVSQAYLTLNPSYAYDISVYSTSSTKMLSKSVSNTNAFNLNLESLTTGSYLLYLSSGTDKPTVFQFIKE